VTRALLGFLAFGAVMAAQDPAQDPMVEGRADSGVQVVIFEDLACSDCAAFRVMLDKTLLPRHQDHVAFVHRDFPLAKHPWAKSAAIAARWFSQQDAATGIAFRRDTLAHITLITTANLPERVRKFAVAHSLDGDAAVHAMDDPKLRELVEKDMQDGIARGVVHTPTVFVNGKPFVESFPVAEISKAIDDARALAVGGGALDPPRRK
jgi:protein-disulfide isomerase